MKANELMIGDWIKPKNVDFYFRVGLIGADTIWNHTDTAEWDLDEIEPIQLTPEILVKNGWERTGGASHRIYGNYNATIFHWNENRKEIIIDKNGERHYMLKLDLLYVHELQHALRLCGIEKEIVV